MSNYSSPHFIIATLLLLAVSLPQGALNLKLLQFSVPPYILLGEIALLQCRFELEKNKLYAVKWYKDEVEFYRYVPRSKPPQQSYVVDGIKVDLQLSDSQKVTVGNINLAATGMYRCEVSAEAPSFTSVNGEGLMEVIALPKEGPEITGAQQYYQVGDVISLNCTSGESFPPAKLTWYINGSPVQPDYDTKVQQQHGLVSSVAGLTLEAVSQHFQSGHMQVRCVAMITTTASNSEFEDKREAILLLKGDASSPRRSALTALLLMSLTRWLVS